MSTPMSMSLDYLRKHGYYAVPVEQNNIAIPGWKHKTKRDLFGFADIVALKDHVLLVQATSETNVGARITKIVASEAFEPCKRAGIRIEVHGWGKHDLRIVDMNKEKPDYSAILQKRYAKQLVRQADLVL